MATCPSLPDAWEGDVGNLHWSDLLVIVLYFVVIIVVGILSSLKNRGSVDGFFLGGQSMHWLLVGASLFSSCIGSEHFIGLAGTAAASGLAVYMFELNAVFVLILLGWIFTPVYLSAGVFTMPEYLKKRFGGTRIQVYLSVLALLLYVFTKISANLFAGALFLKVALNQGKYESVVILIVISAIFTITGGLTAVMFTDTLETLIMVIGGIYLGVLSLYKVGGYNEMERLFPRAIPLYPTDTPERNLTQCFDGVPSNYMHLMRPVTDAELPWTGITFGLTISATWYWCTDQVIVQRTLSAKNLSHAKAGTVFAGYIKILPIFMMIFPGMISRILYQDVVGCYDPDICEACCGSRKGCTNLAYPTLVMQLMPHGARGLMLAVMMAALMSSQTSIFNSASTIFTMDIWRRIRSTASEIELMIVSRIFVVALLVVSILWIPIIEAAQGSQLFDYIQSITSYLAPPICAIFVLGVSWGRINEPGAFWGLMVGLAIGLTRFILEFTYVGIMPDCLSGKADPTPSIVTSVHYLHFGVILFVIVFIVTIIVSLLTHAPDRRDIINTTFASRNDLAECRSTAPSSHQSTAVLSEGAQNMEVTPKPIDAAAAYDGLPFWKKAALWICGVSEMKRSGVSEPRPLLASIGGPRAIRETKTSRWICNINALILCVVAIFIWGYFF